jgi:hypothetical protein
VFEKIPIEKLIHELPTQKFFDEILDVNKNTRFTLIREKFND